MDKEILITSLGFFPNIGGLETHLSDLVTEVAKNKIKCHVLTYQPLTTDIHAKYYEKSKSISIIRLPKFGRFFYNLTNTPFLEFLYLFPGMFLSIPIILLKNPKIKTIHSHGLICGIASVMWSKIFNKKVITTTHSNYTFSNNSVFTIVSKIMFRHSDIILCLSNFSKNEVVQLGIDQNKIHVFRYWIDLETFKPSKEAKRVLSWDGFNLLFVGRLVKEKGIFELLDAKKQLNKKINVHFIGTGPLESIVKASGNRFHGKISQNYIANYYSAADLVIVPSVHDEGYGRVILESLACGTPVVASNRGGISEALDTKCGIKINISPQQIAKTVNYLYDHPIELKKLKSSCRKYAIQNYSSSNASVIINEY